MKHLGDITKISGYEVPVVDCVIGGSPCQDLSVAGKRAGLAGARSGLYMDQIRVIKEMRENDRNNGRSGVDIRPRYMVWENVPGAFSSNKGRDFAAVLEETIRIAEPEAPDIHVPEKGWPTAGCYMDEDGNFSVAWRVLDAQFWGTSDKPLPQRRRRIALVADFGGLSAPEILFVRESVSGHTEPGEPKRKGTAGPAEGSTGGAGKSPVNESASFYPQMKAESQCFRIDETCNTLVNGINPGLQNALCYAVDQGGKSGANSYEDVSPTLTCTHDGAPAVDYVAAGFKGLNSAKARSDGYEYEKAPCLSANKHDACVCVKTYDARGNGDGENVNTLTGDHNRRISDYSTVVVESATVVYGISPYHSNGMKSGNPHSGIYEAETARTLDALQCGYPACNQGGMAVVQPLCIEMTSTKNTVVEDGICPTLTARMGTGGNQVNTVMRSVAEPHLMDAYQHHGYREGDTCGTLTAGQNNSVRGDTPLVVTGVDCAQYIDTSHADDVIRVDDVVAPLQARDYKGGKNVVVAGVDCRNGSEHLELFPTLQAKPNGGQSLNYSGAVRVRHIVRRLTPLECERLQGFPDGWTDIGDWIDSKGKKHKAADSPRYKALGNSIALPPWKWVLKRLCACYERDATMASLFDGIGGFPLIWEQLNGKGSCLWASEIEEFPMAVTKLRFGE